MQAISKMFNRVDIVRVITTMIRSDQKFILIIIKNIRSQNVKVLKMIRMGVR